MYSFLHRVAGFEPNVPLVGYILCPKIYLDERCQQF